MNHFAYGCYDDNYILKPNECDENEVILYNPNHIARGISAVSYTHLDVYKRQEYNILFDEICNDWCLKVKEYVHTCSDLEYLNGLFSLKNRYIIEKSRRK